MPTEETAPTRIDQTAPQVVKRFQTIDISSAGKLALAAMAKARPTMKATFWPWKAMPSATATTPKTTVAILAALTCSSSVARPFLMTLT